MMPVHSSDLGRVPALGEYVVPAPAQFMTDEGEAQHQRERAALRAKQTAEYAVAPNAQVQCVDRVARGGEEITLADLGGNAAAMRRAVDAGAVWQLSEMELMRSTRKPTGYVTSTALTAKAGILEPGTPVSASDFKGGKDTLASLVERGLVIPDEVA